jgi:hypothetical protein
MNGDVFGGGNYLGKVGNVFVEKGVVKRFNHIVIHGQLFEAFRQIGQHASARINGALSPSPPDDSYGRDHGDAHICRKLRQFSS